MGNTVLNLWHLIGERRAFLESRAPEDPITLGADAATSVATSLPVHQPRIFE